MQWVTMKYSVFVKLYNISVYKVRLCKFSLRTMGMIQKLLRKRKHLISTTIRDNVGPHITETNYSKIE